MRDEEIIRAIDRIEADLRGLESRLFSLRSALRERIDPQKRRKDLGYWYADEPRLSSPQEPR
jgi:hypothetical protein